MIRWMVIILVACMACQSGKIPCPELKGAKLKKTNIHKRTRYVQRSSRSKDADDEKTEARRTTVAQRETPAHQQTRPALEHVDVEEWDCPKPGMKKDLPKAVKANIRKNAKRMRDHYRSRNQPDTLYTTNPSRARPDVP